MSGGETVASIDRVEFGEHQGQIVFEYRLKNINGLSIAVITYGAILKELCVKDRVGQLADIVLGFDTLQEYIANGGCFGATCGRTAGRTSVKGFCTDEGHFKLEACDAPFISKGNNCHGGPVGFNHVVWTAVAAETTGDGGCFVRLRYVSPDEDQGYPGELTTNLCYTLTADNELVLEYEATSTRDTPCSLTNHSYFNLGGHEQAAGNAAGIKDHALQLECDAWLVTGCEGTVGPNGNHVSILDASHGVSSDGIPTGELRSVTDSHHDFRSPTLLGPAMESVAAAYPEWPHGDAYLCRSQEILECAQAARVTHEPSGRAMSVLSTEPVAQLYFSTLNRETAGKGAAKYDRHGGLCIEMQRFADALGFGEETDEKRAYVELAKKVTLLKAGEVYRQRTIYAFSSFLSGEEHPWPKRHKD